MLGKGSFGQVIEARDEESNETVAIKIIKSRRAFHQQGLIEISILEELSRRDPEDAKNIGAPSVL
jgi:serine/threonine protein kinase